MKNITTKVAAFLSTAAVVLYAAAPALAATDILVNGNGAGSASTVNSTSTSTRTVDQTNSFSGTTTITASPNSGNNTITNQTGGDATIGTGNVSSTVQTVTRANLNQLQDGLTPSNSNETLGITGNGALSSNAVTTNNTKTDSIFQTNTADVTNSITADPNSGNNAITNGTGGSETLVTGHATANVGVQNQVNANVANLGSAAATSTNGTGVNALISGNGAASANTVDLSNNRVLTFVQNNDAYIDTAVDASPNSGNNALTNNTESGPVALTSAGFIPLSTGGGTRLDTGNATSTVVVNNQANANVASDGTSSLPRTNILVDGNGALSSNTTSNASLDTLSLFQGAGTNSESGSSFDTTTAITADPYSGYNSGLNNTLQAGDTSLLVTGHALSDTRVTNQGNVNMFGPSSAIVLPGGTTLGFSFNLGGLLSMVH